MSTFPSATSVYHGTTYPALSPSRPELSAKGKTIAITGGGTGIGAETARYFAEAGAARIALFGRREQPLLDTKASINARFPNVDVFTASTDIANQVQVDTSFAEFVGDGKINVLVSNAAVIGPVENVDVVDVSSALQSIAINIGGSMNVARAFLRHAALDAVVIDVNSAVAHFDFGGYLASYSISKLAVFRIWHNVGNANPGIKVFHLHPGAVETDMSKSTAGGIELPDHVSLPASFQVWLASSEAHFLKGKFVWANWDVDELKSRSKEIEESQLYNFDLVGWPFGQDYKFVIDAQK